jgi:hypothetical protein
MLFFRSHFSHNINFGRDSSLAPGAGFPVAHICKAYISIMQFANLPHIIKRKYMLQSLREEKYDGYAASFHRGRIGICILFDFLSVQKATSLVPSDRICPADQYIRPERLNLGWLKKKI